GRITSRLFEAKVLQARAVLLRRARVAALVALSASMDDPDNPAAEQLTRFLAASQPLPRYIDALRSAEAAPVSNALISSYNRYWEREPGSRVLATVKALHQTVEPELLRCPPMDNFASTRVRPVAANLIVLQAP